MKIRGVDSDVFTDGHDHRCADCPQSVLHLPSEICGSCGRCKEHTATWCPAAKEREAKRKGDVK